MATTMHHPGIPLDWWAGFDPPPDSQRLSQNPALTRIEGKRLDYASGGLEHYLEIDPAGDGATIIRYRLVEGALQPVQRARSEMMVVTEPFPYRLDPAAFRTGAGTER